MWGTREYFIYDPDTKVMEGYRLVGRAYRPAKPDAQGRFWCEQLGVSFGLWHGVYEGRERDWVRLFRPDGSLVPSAEERAEARAEAERQRAEAERQRAEAAEAELARLRALLEERSSS